MIHIISIKKLSIFTQFSQVVEEESAWIPSRGDRAPIRANHIDICKYSTKEDEGYVKVLNAIKKILEMYHPAPEKNAGQGITARDVGILVGRDQTVQGDNVAGDKVGGDKFTGDKVMGNKAPNQ